MAGVVARVPCSCKEEEEDGWKITEKYYAATVSMRSTIGGDLWPTSMHIDDLFQPSSSSTSSSLQLHGPLATTPAMKKGRVSI